MDDSNISCEPMDVDTSLNSTKNDSQIALDPAIKIKEEPMDKENYISRPASTQAEPSTANNTIKYSDVKVYHINYERKTQGKSTSRKIIDICVLILIPIAFSLYLVNCNYHLDAIEVNKVLNEKLYGQDQAIKKICRTLKSDYANKILFFYGGTGVGKTYSASLILDHVQNCSNIYHYTMPSFRETFSRHSLFALNWCKSAVIIVDDLTNEDVTEQVNSIISDTESLKANVTIILIYNCDTIMSGFIKHCDESFRIKLEEQFSHINAFKEFVHFESLTNEHLRKCIQDSMGNTKLYETQIRDFMKNFNVASDGCKGVSSKMQFFKLRYD